MQAQSLFSQFLIKLKKLILFLIFLILFLSLLFFLNYFFSIKTINIISSERIKLTGLNNLKNKNILLFDEKKVIDNLIQLNPLIKSLAIEKQYPDTININYHLYSPLISFKASNGYFYLSEDGRILTKKTEDNSLLPTINYYQLLDYQSYHIGDRIDYIDIKNSLYFLKVLNNLSLTIDSLDIKDRDMLVFKVGTKEILFSCDKDIEKQEYEVSEIIRTFKIEGRSFSVIDLRFDKPVVKF